MSRSGSSKRKTSRGVQVTRKRRIHKKYASGFEGKSSKDILSPSTKENIEEVILSTETAETEVDLDVDEIEEGDVDTKFDALKMISTAHPSICIPYKYLYQAAMYASVELKRKYNSIMAMPIRPSEKQKFIYQTSVDARKLLYDAYHGCSGSVCTICEMKQNFQMCATWRMTLNENGVAPGNWSPSKRLRQSYSTHFAIWAPKHSVKVQELSTEAIRRFSIHYYFFRHPSMSLNHFHYHVVHKTAKVSDWTIVDIHAADSLRRTVACMHLNDGDTDTASDLYQPVKYFWECCTDKGKAALDARGRLFNDPDFFMEEWDVNDYVNYVLTYGRVYDDIYSSGKIPKPPYEAKQYSVGVEF